MSSRRKRTIRAEEIRPDAPAPEWADAIADGDWDSAGFLWLQCQEVLADGSRGIGEQQSARRTALALSARFPGLREHAAGASARRLGVEGNPRLRRTRDQERELWPGDRPRDLDRRAYNVNQEPLGVYAVIFPAARRLLRILLWPWPQLIKRPTATQRVGADPDEEVPF